MTSITVAGTPMGQEALDRIVHRRTLVARVRHTLGSADPLRIDTTVYWPIVCVRATADGRWLRKEWSERAYGAVDLVTGRVGLIDADLPPLRTQEVDPAACVEPELDAGGARDKWDAFFRNYVERRRKPLQPPAYTVDTVEPMWLPHHVVSEGSQQLVVDPMTRRAEPLADFPPIHRMLTGTPA